jgi:GT2 family glycosyltransferase
MTTDDIKDKIELIEVKANGMGFMLVKAEVFNHITDPFEPLYPDQWEDFTFQEKAREAGFKSYIDPTLIIGHEKKTIL